MKKLLAVLMMTFCVVAFTQVDLQAKTKKHSKRGKIEMVWGCMIGNVGKQEIFEFVIDPHSGDAYYHIDGVRRTIKYTLKGNHLVSKAYLRGKYIGYFDGKITYSLFSNELRILSYEGTFFSVNGSKLDFYLQNSAA